MNFLKKIFHGEGRATTTSSDPLGDLTSAFFMDYNAGTSALDRGDNRTAVDLCDRAIKAWEDATRRNPSKIPEEMIAMCLTNRGTALQRMGNENEAIASYDRSISLFPYFVMAHYNKAWLLEQAERVTEAITAWEAYLMAAGNDVRERQSISYAREHLSQLKAMTGRF